jgi:hypothetical protein
MRNILNTLLGVVLGSIATVAFAGARAAQGSAGMWGDGRDDCNHW